LSDQPSSATLTIMAATVASDGASRLKPSVYFSPTAQATSQRPAMNRISQAKPVLTYLIVAKYDSAAAIVPAMSASEWAAETNPASKADGAK